VVPRIPSRPGRGLASTSLQESPPPPENHRVRSVFPAASFALQSSAPRTQLVGSTTKWLRPKAQGCCAQLPWGMAAMLIATQRGCHHGSTSKAIRWVGVRAHGHNPVGVAELIRRPSQGSRVQQPWAGGWIPFGEIANSPTCPRPFRPHCRSRPSTQYIARRFPCPTSCGVHPERRRL